MPMRRSPELRPTVWDGLVVLAVVLLAGGCLLAMSRAAGRASGGLTAVVTVDGREVDRFAPEELLETPRIYENNGYTLEVRAGEAVSTPGGQPAGGARGIRVAHADCPTQDCVRTGTITRGGQSAVCLPARIIIRLEGGGTGGGPDIVSG